MNTIRFLVVLAISVAASTALAQQAPPSENKGMSASRLSGLDLSKQGLNDLDQRQMRIRQIIIEPGGVVAFHSHAQRPALTYVLKGTLLEHRKGGPDRMYRPGEVITESRPCPRFETVQSENQPLLSVRCC